MDRPTRGRTAPGRLRALDAFLVHTESELLSRSDGLFVDVGFGESPITTLEAAKRFRALNPTLEVIGLERDEQRVQGAQNQADARTHFCHGTGFVTPAATLVRVMNVLRTYPEEHVEDAHRQLGQGLLEGGLLVEGSAERDGSILTAHLQRKRVGHLHREALLFYTDFSRGFAPLRFRDWLPRDLRRRVKPGEAIHTFLQTWTQAWESTRTSEPAQSFAASAAGLGACDPWLLQRGYFLWKPVEGVPR